MSELQSAPHQGPHRAPHRAVWPPGLPHHLALPETHLFHNVEVSAQRFPDKPYLIFYDTQISYARFKDEAERLAGYLQQACGVKRGDRVLLFMQNSPQFVLAYYAILRADAVVVPVNPMNLSEELQHYVQDAQASVILAAQELFPQVQPLLHAGRASGQGLQHAIVATYSDYLEVPTDLRVPDVVTAPRQALNEPGAVTWSHALSQSHQPAPMCAGPDDLAVLPYTSGTTSHPKGCMHTHRSVMYNVVARGVWLGSQPESVQLAVLPFFHVTGMQNAMNGTLYLGATAVLLPRWDREVALQCIARYKVTGAQMISTMVVDMLNHPRIDEFDLRSLNSIGGGGAAMPEAIATKLKALTGLDYIEGYGMSETMAATHVNPVHRPMKQCLGIPIFDVDARVVDPLTFEDLPPNEVGEIIVSGPQVMKGYWRNPQADEESFIERDDKRFLRTGDLARVDEHGYFFMVDRLKRMINASGFKVWPAEVEALMYHHPAIQEVCVIAAPDEKRGETVKAVVVLKPDQQALPGQITEQTIIDWAHTHMAAYKAPRIVQFVAQLPRSGTGKIQWRTLQDQEHNHARATDKAPHKHKDTMP
ncbi:MAG: long-chain fatty acid--CoA ligase [Aquabacterium sp.]|uniref:long-chain fatty acid--CoA ligase n=1 Tax=Aquabacterium sp. TaxID=1872578 RepID=UPI001227A1CF|nr:long-chain fatty acid--CoA ligase [Aquabacterium sp.]TAK85221.1 MAG: long-chain fatty acid--CoA ligase [Aquabacterium sp.]